MADKRINALTTTSASVGDDYFAIDGATNGTRALSAFSPTFGGNATVTGTLTVNSTLTANGPASGITVNGAGITLDNDPAGSSASLRFVDGATPRFWIYKLSGDSNLYFRDMTNGRMQLQMLPGATSSNAISTFNSILSVTSTTASTTTSTGALVVGNGTSGGLGVGGAVNIGGTLSVLDGGTASSAGTIRLSNNTSIGWRNAANSADIFLTVNNSNIFSFGSGAPVYVNNTTASTTTSSGALVVSGGVGVGGNLSIGGDVLIDKSAIEVLLKRGANTNDGLIKFQTGIFGDFGIGHRGTSDSDLHIYNYGTAADALKIAKSDSLATFAAAIRTAAPSGGTAANWKLGTVATVSPTSPNRTIEVDIGGTIYYIHAKTTNN